MPLSIDQINEQLNAKNPGKIAVVYSVDKSQETKFIYSMEDFDPKNWSLLSCDNTCSINTPEQKQLAECEIAFSESMLTGLHEDDVYWYECVAALQSAIIQYLEEQLEFYKDSPYAEVGD